MHRIKKEFEFDYGHRVWSQTLVKSLSIDDKLVCRHLHGHRGVVEVYLEGEKLKHGMVTDFKHLNWLKVALDEFVDHKFIIDMSDPMFEKITGVALDDMTLKTNFIEIGGNNYTTQTASIVPPENATEADIEVVGGFTVCYFVPTSENLAKWLFEIVDAVVSRKIPGVKVSKVIWRETPKTYAEYSK